MKIGFIGLGKMGQAMVLHLLEKGVEVVVWNRTQEKMDILKSKVKSQKSKPQLKTQKLGDIIPASNINDMVMKLDSPRIIWLMVKQGKPVDEVIEKLLDGGLEMGDVIIDGGNSFYKDSVKRYQKLKALGIGLLDVGTSGGLEGARKGACLMVGGDREIYQQLVPLFEKMAVEGGFAYFGASGAGHFVKMVHNGVEYGMLEAIGEGFEILFKGPYKLNYQEIAQNWSKGSVVRGWLMELLDRAFKKDPELKTIQGIVSGGTTGEWTIETAEELHVEASVIKRSLEARKKSKKKQTFAGKVVAALRREFGGHPV